MNSTLFPVRNPVQVVATTLMPEVASAIVGTTVGPGLMFDNLDPPVRISLLRNNFTAQGKVRSYVSAREYIHIHALICTCRR